MSMSGKIGGSLNGSSRPIRMSSLSGRLITTPPSTSSRRAMPVGAMAGSGPGKGAVPVPPVTGGTSGAGVTTGATGTTGTASTTGTAATAGATVTELATTGAPGAAMSGWRVP